MEECAAQLLSEAVAQLADTTRWQQYNPTTTSALDMLISLPYVASKDADYP